MKIAQLIQALGYGGLEIQALRLSEITQGPIIGYDREETSFAPGAIDLTQDFQHSRWSFISKLRKILKDVDIIHTHSMGAFFWASLAAPEKKHVLTIHSRLDNDFGFFLKVIRPLLYRRATMITVPSEDILKYYPGAKLMPNIPTNPGQTFSRPQDLPPGPFDLWVGRLIAPKDPLLVWQSHPKNVPMIFLGDGPLRKDLEAQGAKVLGFRPNTADYIHFAQKVILCSRSESAPLSIIESLSLGVPVVVSAVGDMREWLEQDPVRGILVTSHSHTAWKEALESSLAFRPKFQPVVDYRASRNAWLELYESL